MSLELRYNTTPHVPSRCLCTILMQQFCHVLFLNLTAFVVRVKVKDEQNCTENTDSYVRQVELEDIYNGKDYPDKTKKHKSPPKSSITSSRILLLVYFAFEFPLFLAILVEVYPPTKTDKKPA